MAIGVNWRQISWGQDRQYRPGLRLRTTEARSAEGGPRLHAYQSQQQGVVGPGEACAPSVADQSPRDPAGMILAYQAP
jgi:hypothetical protein